MENQSQSPELNVMELKVSQLESDLKCEKERNSNLSQTIALQKALMEELAEKAEPALEAEYRAILREFEEGKTVDGPGLLLSVSKLGGAA